ncbi:MAG: YdcF family protein [Lachnospiraceae bacterium]|nr:YdcF family protein [Lachnospiraceae bacterium]
MQKIGYIAGALSLFYFITYGILAGLTNAFTFFWLLLGIFLLAVAWWYPGLKKWLLRLPKGVTWPLAGVLLCGVLAFCVAEGMVIGYGQKEPKPGADYVIVLGGQVRGSQPSYNLKMRLDKAYDYLKENPTARVILSGGQGSGEDISEAQAMMEYLKARGVGEERMILEDQSTNTEENFRFTKEKLQSFGHTDGGEEKDWEELRFVVVTNRFHIFRSMGIAKKQGFAYVEGLGSSTQWYTVPNLYVREAFAVIKYVLWGQM